MERKNISKKNILKQKPKKSVIFGSVLINNFDKLMAHFKFFFKSHAAEEVTLFQKSRYPLSFRPFLLAQGLVVLLLIFVSISFFIPQHKVNQASVIKAVALKQSSTIIAGQPVKWTVLVKRSEIANGKYLLKLPKGAKNVEIKSINTAQFEKVLSEPQEELSLIQKQQSIKSPVDEGFFAQISHLMSADIGDGVENAVQTITGSSADQTDQNTVSTPDADYVDLSSQASPSPSTSTASPVLTTINITPLTVSLTAGGATQQLSAGTLDQNGANIDAALTWSSDNTAVATVDNTGLITPVNAGTANITASSGSVTSTAPSVITVTASATPPSVPASPSTSTASPVLTTINITPLTVSLTAGGATQQLSAGTLDQNGANIDAALTWSSDNTAVATVDNTGLVTPVSAGTANITASSGSVTSTAPSVITVLASDYVAVQYTTPAPQITQQSTSTGEQVTVSATDEDPNAPLVDILASAKIPKIFKVGEENKIHIKWKNNGNQDVTFHAYDTDNDGYLDYVEWTVPHLSDQEFDIIFTSKDFQLDSGPEYCS